MVAEASWASFKPHHYLGQPVSCVLVGESRLKYPVSQSVGHGGGETLSQPVGHLVSQTQRQADMSQSLSYLIRDTVRQPGRETVSQ